MPQLHFIDQDSLQTSGRPSLDCGTKPPCQQTKDYWNAQLDAWTIHAAPMRLGNTYVYSKSQVVDLFNTSVDGDAAIVLAQELAQQRSSSLKDLNLRRYSLPSMRLWR